MTVRPYLLIVGITIVLLGFAAYYMLHPLRAKVVIRNTTFTVSVAATEQQKRKGLGGVVSLGAQDGMLFPYDHTEQYEFWMKDMVIPLDFVWIDGHTVADITENVPPPSADTPLSVLKPKVPVDKILELSAGSVRRFGISVGDTVRFLDR